MSMASLDRDSIRFCQSREISPPRWRLFQSGLPPISSPRRKCRLVPKKRGVSLHTAIVYEGEIAPSVEADGYFDAVIPFRRLLGI